MRSIIIFLSIVLVSCASYQEPDLPPEARALITQPHVNFGDYTSIVRVDGLAPSRDAAYGLANHTGQLVLAPGKHVLRCKYNRGSFWGSVDLWLVAEVGKTYELKVSSGSSGLLGNFKFRMWLEDAETKLPVGGEVGSKNEPK